MKLRVSSGVLGGRKFDAPQGNTTHPMSEKIRSAIFNILGDISDLTILDAFAGSGSLSFESLSRGAKCVYAVEKDKKAFNTLSLNKMNLGIGNELNVSLANVASWLKTNNLSFDIIFCDPPFNNLKLEIINQMDKFLNYGGLLVCSIPTQIAKEFILTSPKLKKITTKKYANATIVIYKKQPSY